MKKNGLYLLYGILFILFLCSNIIVNATEEFFQVTPTVPSVVFIQGEDKGKDVGSEEKNDGITDCGDDCGNKGEGDKKTSSTGCDGIKLNTDFPLIGHCISLKKGGTGVNVVNVLPQMIGSLMKIIMSVVMVVCFIMIIIAGIKRSSNDTKTARDLIKKVAITILVLGLSGVILKVINPLFFS